MKLSEYDFLEKCEGTLIENLLKGGLTPQKVIQIVTDKREHVFNYLDNLSKHEWNMTLFIKLEIKRIMRI